MAISGLHISKVAVGCASIDALRLRVQARANDGVMSIRTRFRPKRSGELIGGSLYWIVKHRIAARQAILGFDNDLAEGKTIIQLDPILVPVRAQPRRAHQGWRYLSADEAPEDWDTGSLETYLPTELFGTLSALALI